MKHKLFNQMKQRKFNFCHDFLFLRFIKFEKNSGFKYYEKILYYYICLELYCLFMYITYFKFQVIQILYYSGIASGGFRGL
jgi:hypothetical protein